MTFLGIFWKKFLSVYKPSIGYRPISFDEARCFCESKDSALVGNISFMTNLILFKNKNSNKKVYLLFDHIIDLFQVLTSEEQTRLVVDSFPGDSARGKISAHLGIIGSYSKSGVTWSDIYSSHQIKYTSWANES